MLARRQGCAEEDQYALHFPVLMFLGMSLRARIDRTISCSQPWSLHKGRFGPKCCERKIAYASRLRPWSAISLGCRLCQPELLPAMADEVLYRITSNSIAEEIDIHPASASQRRQRNDRDSGPICQGSRRYRNSNALFHQPEKRLD